MAGAQNARAQRGRGGKLSLVGCAGLLVLVRGLIERKVYPHDRKRFMYTPTVALLATLGVETVKALPDYERINTELRNASVGAETETNGEIGEQPTA